MSKCQWRCDHCDLLLDDPKICCDFPAIPQAAGDTGERAADERNAGETLTDEQIERIARNHGTGGWQSLDDMTRFARALLAAAQRGNP